MGEGDALPEFSRLVGWRGPPPRKIRPPFPGFFIQSVENMVGDKYEQGDETKNPYGCAHDKYPVCESKELGMEDTVDESFHGHDKP